jgi:hypothetical protein
LRDAKRSLAGSRTSADCAVEWPAVRAANSVRKTSVRRTFIKSNLKMSRFYSMQLRLRQYPDSERGLFATARSGVYETTGVIASGESTKGMPESVSTPQDVES